MNELKYGIMVGAVVFYDSTGTPCFVFSMHDCWASEAPIIVGWKPFISLSPLVSDQPES